MEDWQKNFDGTICNNEFTSLSLLIITEMDASNYSLKIYENCKLLDEQMHCGYQMRYLAFRCVFTNSCFRMRHLLCSVTDILSVLSIQTLAAFFNSFVCTLRVYHDGEFSTFCLLDETNRDDPMSVPCAV